MQQLGHFTVQREHAQQQADATGQAWAIFREHDAVKVQVFTADLPNIIDIIEPRKPNDGPRE